MIKNAYQAVTSRFNDYWKGKGKPVEILIWRTDMAKLTEKQYDLQGHSGRTYSFNMYAVGTYFTAVEGVYIFTKGTKVNDSYEHENIYLGEINDLSQRFEDHYMMQRVMDNGGNCVCILPVLSKEERQDILADLLKAHETPCNN